MRFVGEDRKNRIQERVFDAMRFGGAARGRGVPSTGIPWSLRGLLRIGFGALLAIQAQMGQTWAGSIVGVRFNGEGAPTQWTNETSLGTTHNLPNEAGANSGISLTTSITGTLGLFNYTLEPATIPTGDSNLNGINGNFFNETTFTAVLSGLAAGATYDVWVFTARADRTIAQKVVITGAETTSFIQNDPNSPQLVVNSTIGSSTRDLNSYALPIVAGDSGVITINIDTLTGNGAAISAIALESVPEPGTLSLAACGALSLAAYGLMRRKPATV